jgi:hypothetical protein
MKLYSTIPVERRSFAAKLKASAAALLGLSLEEMERMKRDDHMPAVSLHDPERSISGMGYRNFTMREFLQRYGTEAHREIFGEDFWVTQTLPEYDPAYTEKLVVITDCRFPNEAERILDLGGEVWEVIGDNDERSNHPSDARLAEKYLMFQIRNDVRDDNYRRLDGILQECLDTRPASEVVADIMRRVMSK